MSYTAAEVRYLVENYQIEMGKRDTTHARIPYIVRIADVDRALGDLPDHYYEVVLLHGMLNLPMGKVGDLLGISKQAVSKRYANALEDMHWLMNHSLNA